MLISGKSPAALQSAARQWAEWLRSSPAPAFYDIAYNSVFRRDWHQHRALIYADSAETLALRLDQWSKRPLSEQENESDRVAAGAALDNAYGPVFAYMGNGSQWAGMGKRLLEHPAFRAAVRAISAMAHCGDIFSPA